MLETGCPLINRLMVKTMNIDFSDLFSKFTLMANLTPREQDIITRIGAGETIDNIGSSLKLDEDFIMQCLDTIRGKVISNEHSRDIVEAAQKGLTSVIKRIRRGKSRDEYITKEEFDSFKENLRERFKYFIDG